MIVHFATSYKVICNNQMTRNGGALYSKFKKFTKYRDFHKDVTWLFTTTDEPITCPDCIKLRITFHEEVLASLRSKL